MIHVAPFGNTNDLSIISYLNYGIQNYFARIAVPFFFVCSGFFLYKKTDLNNFSFLPTKKYALRLFRLYLIWTLVYFPLSLRFDLYQMYQGKGIIYAVIFYIRNFIFTGSYGQLWYLNATIFSVLLISFLLSKKFSPKKIAFAAFILYVIGLLAQSWYGIIIPLRTLTPHLWSLLKIMQKIIVTTRDGLFDGFLFVSLGMLFAFYKISIPKRKALIGFIASMILMLVEVFTLEYFNFDRGNDMYLFLIPATFFLFSFISQINLPNNILYKKLRILSSLIFYLHLWISVVMAKLLRVLYEPLATTCMRFFLTLTVTIVISLVIIKMSESQKFKWLKIIYT